MRGTIRLTEIEIYGLEKKDETTSMVSSEDAADEQLLDAIFTEESAASMSLASAASASEDFPHAGVGVAATPQGRIEAVIRGFASAYTNRDLSALMATISPNYSKDGENYEQLRQKMAGVFRRYAQIDFSLQRLRIQREAGKATVDADYVIALTSAGSSPSTLSGKLFFALVESENEWQISSIDTQGR